MFVTTTKLIDYLINHILNIPIAIININNPRTRFIPILIVEKIISNGAITSTPKRIGILNMKATSNNIARIKNKDNSREPVKLVFEELIQEPTSPLELNT
jgi:hypothetical protein